MSKPSGESVRLCLNFHDLCHIEFLALLNLHSLIWKSINKQLLVHFVMVCYIP